MSNMTPNEALVKLKEMCSTLTWLYLKRKNTKKAKFYYDGKRSIDSLNIDGINCLIEIMKRDIDNLDIKVKEVVTFT